MPNDRLKCCYQFPNGRFCRRWAGRGQRFCQNHQPWPDRLEPREMETLHPLERLATVEDVFDVTREALNAARLGRITPGQAYAVGHLVQVWLRVRDELNIFERDTALRRQLIPELTENEEVADEAVAETVPALAEPADEPAPVPAAAPASLPSAEHAEEPAQAGSPPAKLGGAFPGAPPELQKALAGMLREARNGR